MDNFFKLDPEHIGQIAQVLKSLGHPQRLRIFEVLAEGERNVSQIQAQVDLPQAVVSQHLRIMRNGGVIRCRREGTFSLYQLSQKGLYNLLECLRRCQSSCKSPGDVEALPKK